jgi:hypothetical protein
LSPASRVLALLAIATLFHLMTGPLSIKNWRVARKEVAMVTATVRSGLRAAALTFSAYYVDLAATAASG